MIHFTLDLKPQPKQRPRVTKTGHAYTPQATREFERAVKTMVSAHISEPLSGALSLEVLFVYPRLKSEPKRRPERKYKITRPDLSNLVKSLEDGLEGVAFTDDAQISRTVSEKIHAALHEEAHIEVTLRELDQYRTRGIGHTNADGERRARTGEDSDSSGSETVQTVHTNARGETRALTRRERSEINRREHKIKQEARDEEKSRERSARKIAGAIIKLKAVTDERRQEAEERAREAEEARQQRWRDMEARYQAARERRSTNWRDYVSSDDDDSSGSP